MTECSTTVRVAQDFEVTATKSKTQTCLKYFRQKFWNLCKSNFRMLCTRFSEIHNKLEAMFVIMIKTRFLCLETIRRHHVGNENDASFPMLEYVRLLLHWKMISKIMIWRSFFWIDIWPICWRQFKVGFWKSVHSSYEAGAE